MKQKPTLVIIPGIGDDLQIYQTFASRWARFGYDVHVISFGWYEHSATLELKFRSFLKKLDAVSNNEVYLIGISAGGPVAVHAMAVRKNIKKIITVCSPLNTMFNLRNPLLAESVEQARQLLLHFNSEQKSRVLSVHAIHDPIVDIRLSKPKDIRTLRVAVVLFHPLAIFVAMVFYARRMNAFLKSTQNDNLSS